MDKLKGIKPGDGVRVTFEASVVEAGGGGDYPIRLRPHGAGLDATPGLSIINHQTFHIERIEKPLAVGDRVRETAAGFGEGEVLCVDGEFAFVRWDIEVYGPASIRLSKLERLP